VKAAPELEELLLRSLRRLLVAFFWRCRFDRPSGRMPPLAAGGRKVSGHGGPWHEGPVPN
jgi:hypothetical protein